MLFGFQFFYRNADEAFLAQKVWTNLDCFWNGFGPSRRRLHAVYGGNALSHVWLDCVLYAPRATRHPGF